jgi:esterase/lipase superfamily enzyme
MPNLFVVRAFHREFTSSFLKGGFMAIGWLEDFDLSEIKVDDLYQLFSDSKESENASQNHVNQIKRFLKEIEIGDYVITPSISSGKIHYGVVESNYYYEPNPEDDCTFPHRRKVKWIDEVQRNIFSGGFQAHLALQQTVFRIKGSEEFFSTISFIDYKDMRRRQEDIGRASFSTSKEIGHTFRSTEVISPKEDPGKIIPLYYGTNRNVTGSKSPNRFFGSNLDKLKFGKCFVSIPRGHRQGAIERPPKFFGIRIGENIDQDIVLKGVEPLAEDQFLGELRAGVESHTEKSALIFIHGYNTTFAEAARRSAQIVYDTLFYGIGCFFSWPSAGRKIAYGKDIARAEASMPDLAKFLQKIILHSNVNKLHLIAHSMGNLLLSLTLKEISKDTNITPHLNILNQIILAAPDIDQDVFNNNILPNLQTIGNRRTLYSSDKDQALQASEILRIGLPRLGFAGDNLFVADGLDTVDASNVPSDGNNHSYVFDTKELLSDLRSLLQNGLPPPERGLRARVKNKLTYWLFPM